MSVSRCQDHSNNVSSLPHLLSSMMLHCVSLQWSQTLRNSLSVPFPESQVMHEEIWQFLSRCHIPKSGSILMSWCPSLGIFILRARAKLYCGHVCPARRNFRCDCPRSATKHCFLWNVTMTREEPGAQGRMISMPVSGELRIALQRGGWLVCRNGAGGLPAEPDSAGGFCALGCRCGPDRAVSCYLTVCLGLSSSALVPTTLTRFLIGWTLSGHALGCYVTLGHKHLLRICSNYR